MMRQMKDSGLDWVGTIPITWQIVRAKSIFVQSTSKGNDRLVLLSATQDRGVVDKRTLDGVVQVAANADLSTFKTVHTNDFVISLRSFQGGFEIAHEEGVISPAYTVFRLRKHADTGYYRYLFKSYGFIDKINSLTVGIREGKNIQYEDFANMQLAIPPLSEQRGIAEFLDTKCAEVDELLKVQEAFIDELKAYKQSLITETVTKGLDPTAKMKNSGVEWIGDIPETFEIRRLKYIGTAENGLTYSPNDVCDCTDGGILVLRSSNIQNGKLVFDDNVYVNSAPPQLYVHKGDIILCSRNGSAALVGKSAMVENDIFATFGAFMMRFHSEYNNKYIHLLLTAAISQYKQLFSTTTINQLTVGVFGNLEMPFIEDVAEQEAIAAYLDTKCAEIDQLIALKQEKIETLQNYRKSLIYEYVTGKKQL